MLKWVAVWPTDCELHFVQVRECLMANEAWSLFNMVFDVLMVLHDLYPSIRNVCILLRLSSLFILRMLPGISSQTFPPTEGKAL